MIIKYKILTKIIKNIFLKYGVSDSDSNLLSKNLVETEMMGFTSHGIQRVEQYINDIKIGKIQLGKKIKITKKHLLHQYFMGDGILAKLRLFME